MNHPEQRAINRLTLIYALIGTLCMATIVSGVSAFERRLEAQSEAFKAREGWVELEVRLEALQSLSGAQGGGSERITDGIVRVLPRLGIAKDLQRELLADVALALAAPHGAKADADLRRAINNVQNERQIAGKDLDFDRESSEDFLYAVAFNLGMLSLALTGFGLLFSRRIKALLVSYRQAKEAAESAYAEQERFLAVMSHEIRTPLHVIIGSTELLATGFGSTKGERHVKRIVAASEVLLALVNDALDLIKTSAKATPIVVRPTKLADLPRSTIEMLRAMAEKRGLVLGAEVDGALPEFVSLDAGRVRQVLLNLVGNALKFTDEGGVRVRVAAVPGRAELRFTVDDTGLGIDDSRRAELFQPFSPATAASGRGGTGLGLSISKSLVQQMGGAIDCARNEGGGSTFWFTLPLVAAAAAPAAPETATPDPPKLGAPSARILVIDDHDDCREVMAQMLAHLGYEAVVASSGRTALELVRREAFDLILIDLQMPEMSGAEVAAAMRAEALVGRAPIIGISATALEGEIRRALEAGMDACMSKPLRLSALRSGLADWLARRRLPPSAALTPDDEANSPLDLASLAELIMLDHENPGFLAARLRAFLADADEALVALAEAVASSHRAEVRRAAHRFRTSCGIVGATRAGQAAGELEALAAVGDLAQLTNGLHRLELELGLVRPLFEARLIEGDLQADRPAA